MERVEKLVTENPVVVFAMSSCFMCHVVKRSFFSLGVNPTVYKLDKEPGGKLVGSLDRLMTAHINGTLVPQLVKNSLIWQI
ncbi:hypothetical protein O6H91_04G109400 [Diphasiastrum complanatum]|uniref:Uncharacterized protein n=1 Tax=Diphasiastrum complanatum TaxID=34168 RepID=A0ACC2E068_DIPCM|nr:hypothetical protein O6H91_04G109400 [Diphasiastrum complanatum]